MVKLNTKGVELIKSFEGLRLLAYLCPADVWTIGWGTTVYPDGSKAKAGDTISAARADELLTWDLENKYCKHVTESNIYPHLRTDNEFSALVSFAYNVGRGGLHAPNSIQRRIAAGENYQTVIQSELPRWRNGGGRVLPGLVRRRAAELALFELAAPVHVNIEIALGETGGKVSQFQKALNLWLTKWSKPALATDGIFGPATLAAANDFARNNKESQAATGVSEVVYAKVLAYARNQEHAPGYNQPDIRTYARGADLQLSPNFHLSELTCKCGRCPDQLVSTELVALLQKLRVKVGKPIYITSAYRCPTYNRNVGGATRSRHMVGDAVDIVVSGLRPNLLAEVAREVGFRGGYGIANSFLHLDLGPARTWRY